MTANIIVKIKSFFEYNNAYHVCVASSTDVSACKRTIDTDYLFNNSITGATNIEKTIHKLDRMDAIAGFIPRK